MEATLPPTTTAFSVGISVSISPVSGTNTTGETYSLECSATVTGSTDQPTIIWLDDGAEITSSDATRNVSATIMNPGSSYSSTLTFTPLSASDAGMFMCRATLGDAVETASTDVIVECKL